MLAFRPKKKRFCPSDEPVLYISTSRNYPHMQKGQEMLRRRTNIFIDIFKIGAGGQPQSKFVFCPLKKARMEKYWSFPEVAPSNHCLIWVMFHPLVHCCESIMSIEQVCSPSFLSSLFLQALRACLKGYMSLRKCLKVSLTTSQDILSVFMAVFLFTWKKQETFNGE